MTRTHGIGNQVVLVLLVGGVVSLAPLVRAVLPERFLLDDGHLQLAMDPATAHLTDSSFTGAGTVYDLLGVDGSAPLASLLNLALFAVCVLAALGWNRIREARAWELCVVAAALMIGLVYLGQFSKELLTLGIGALVVLGPRGRVGDLAILLGCVAYGAAVRPYWLIIAALFVLWRLVLARTRSPWALIGVPVLVYAALQPAFAVALGGGLQSARESVNSVRVDSDSVASLIVSPLPDAAGPLGVLAALVMLVLMAVPVPLLVSLSPYHMASGAVILAFWVLVVAPVVRGRVVLRREAAAPRGRIVALRAASLLLAFLLVQALFEPDYGSALKHLAPLLPLVLALLPSARRYAGADTADAPDRADPTSAPAAAIAPRTEGTPA
ncbi:hypothetical protein [Brachybacterium huguangmaarense]